MATNLTPPGPLRLVGNLEVQWKKFKQLLNQYLAGSDLDGKSDKIKIGILLSCLGEECLEVYQSFVFDDNDNNQNGHTYARVLQKFEDYCIPKKNLLFERHVFFSRTQSQGEGHDAYVTTLVNMSSTCAFGELKEELILAQIVRGIRDDSLRMRLLREDQLNLAKAIEFCKIAELSVLQAKTFGNQSNYQQQPTAVAAVKKKQYGQKNTDQSQYSKTDGKNCLNCGGKHEKDKCPAFGIECHFCHKKGHYKKCCFKRKRQKAVNSVEVDTASGNPGAGQSGAMFIGSLVDKGHSVQDQRDWILRGEVNGNHLQMKIDTGADCNVININKLKEVTTERLSPCVCVLESFSRHALKPVGQQVLPIKYKGQTTDVLFVVVQEQVPTVLGVQSAVDMKLVKRIHLAKNQQPSVDALVNEYPHVFEGIGKLPYTYSIDIDTDVSPRVNPPRPVPHAIRDKVKEELQRMEKLEIIEPVQDHSPWVSNMVVVVKPHKIRLCIDPTHLNAAIRREHYPLHTIEEVVSQMPKAKYFAKFDATQGFYQVGLDEQSSELCTFATPFGRYRFKRLPFGIKSAPEIYQKVMDTVIAGIPNTFVIMDDVIQAAETIEELYELSKMFLDRCQENNLTLNRSKCEFGLSELNYVGHVLTSEGVRADPEKVSSVQKMPAPKSKEDVKTFLGTVTYLSKFIPNLSQESAPLRKLLNKDACFVWERPQKESFEKIKDLIVQHTTLSYFDVNKPSVISVDASSYGIGAVLMQEDNPIAYASKSLSRAQQAYAQIEKEALAIQFGCGKFRQYVYGTHFTVETDHRPLESIFKKPINSSPPRLQSLRLKLACYDMDVVYKPGKTLIIADQLSRQPEHEICDEVLDTYMCLHVKQENLGEIAAATNTDPTLGTVLKYIQSGWPKTKAEIQEEVRPYYHFRDELSQLRGILFKANKVVVPEILKAKFLEELHYAHLGITLTQNRARESVFWIGMAKDIENLIQSCRICQEMRGNQQKEPLLSIPCPDQPWSHIAADLCERRGEHYLVIVDHYSGWIEIEWLRKNTTSQNIITHMKSQMARHGIPDKLTTDNGPQFSSREFREFAIVYGFEHITSSPYKPNSNGLAEKAVQTVKRLLEKSTLDDKDPYLALLAYRATPRSASIPSPAQRLFGRRIKTRLPAKKMPTKENEANRRELDSARKEQAKHYDKASKPLAQLTEGTKVYTQTKGRDSLWESGTVLKQVAPRSYEVQMDDGASYRRNRQHIRDTPTNDLPVGTQPQPAGTQPQPAAEEVEVPDDVQPTRRSVRTTKLPGRFQDFVL